MIKYFLYGYLILGSLTFIIILLRYLLPDEEFRRNSREKQRIYKFRRYILLPPVFIAIWPLVIAIIILLPIYDLRMDTMRAVEEMKKFIYGSRDNYISIHRKAI